MSDQFYIAPDGSLQPEPRTWDGEPLYCPDMVREGLFDASAFEQMPGQMPFEVVPASAFMDDDDDAKERATCAECLARTYRGEECVCDDGGDAEDYDVIRWESEGGAS